MQLKDWQAATAGVDPIRAQLLGWSPGGAATQAGVSRQRIHQLIRLGKLDVVEVRDGRQLVMYMIPDASLRSWMRDRDRHLASINRPT